MNRSLLLLLAAAIAVCASHDARGQNLIRRVPVSPISANAEATKPLSVNHRLAFSAKDGDKEIGEISLLTCSPDVSVNGPLGISDFQSHVTVSGSLTEEQDGGITLRYEIGFSVPVKLAIPAAAPGTPGASNVQYQNHSSQGMLRMKAGKAYEVLRVGRVVYSITIAPEPDK